MILPHHILDPGRASSKRLDRRKKEEENETPRGFQEAESCSETYRRFQEAEEDACTSYSHSGSGEQGDHLEHKIPFFPTLWIMKRSTSCCCS